MSADCSIEVFASLTRPVDDYDIVAVVNRPGVAQSAVAKIDSSREAYQSRMDHPQEEFAMPTMSSSQLEQETGNTSGDDELRFCSWIMVYR